MRTFKFPLFMNDNAYAINCVTGCIAYYYSTRNLNIYIMEGEKKNHCEGVPLNSTGANIFLNTGKKTKSNDGTIIHLNTEKPSDVGVHINTTLSIASSKKIKLLFILNFLLSVVCMLISCSIAFYYWNELISMRKQLDVLREQFLIHNIRDGVLHQEKAVLNPILSNLRPDERPETRHSRLIKSETISPNARKYYVEDLGEDMVFLDSSKKNPSQDKLPIYDLSVFQKDPVVAHFHGGVNEQTIGLDHHTIGPWFLDRDSSTKGSESKIELNTDSKIELNRYTFTVKESGLYLMYAQIVYISHDPNCFFIFAGLPNHKIRQITMCATADYSRPRALNKSQMSCSVQTVVRLNKDEVVKISQREENRTLSLKPGFSYIGFIKLSS